MLGPWWRTSTGRCSRAAPIGLVPLIVGSPEDVAIAEDFYAQRR
jgi:hypothetical protein